MRVCGILPQVWALPPFNPANRRLHALQEPSVGRPRLTKGTHLAATFALTALLFAVVFVVVAFVDFDTNDGFRAATRSRSSATLAFVRSWLATKSSAALTFNKALAASYACCRLAKKAAALAVRAFAAKEAMVKKEPAKRAGQKKPAKKAGKDSKQKSAEPRPKRPKRGPKKEQVTRRWTRGLEPKWLQTRKIN